MSGNRENAAQNGPSGQGRIFAVAAGLFVIWGVALWLFNALFFKFTLFFTFGPVQIAFTLAAFHLAYIALALPAVAFHRKFGYKLGFLVGLSVFAVGAFLLYLAVIQNSIVCFLGAVLTIGGCGAWLDTTLNPLAAIAGPRGTVVKRLNLAHACNGIGLFTAYFTAIMLLGRDYQLSGGVTAQISARPYVLVGLGAMLLAFLIEQISLPDAASKGVAKLAGNDAGLGGELRTLAADRRFLFAVAALAAYCAVLTILWTANYRYYHLEMPTRVVPVIERGAFWFAIGRLGGVLFMRWIDPLRLLQMCAGACLVAIAVTAAVGGAVGWAALLSGSLFLAITFPTVYGAALQGHWTRIAAAAGLLAVAAGLGNVLSSLGSSLALDAFQVNPRLVILAALPFEAVVFAYALTAGRRTAA